MLPRPRILCALGLAACTGAPSPVPTAAAPETDEPVHVAVEEATPEPVVWRSAWPVEGGGVYVPGADEAGRLWSMAGSSQAIEGTPCGEGLRFEAEGVLWSPAGEAVSFRPAPTVSAALVERAAWRLAEVAPNTGAITPGVEAPDPALHQGIRVRSVRKIRRQGPPFQVVLGERDNEVLVALTDRDAKSRTAGLVFTRDSAAPMRFGVVPPADLDGDGTPELIVYGDGDNGGFRAVMDIDLLAGRLTERSFEQSAPVRCP